MHNLPNRDEHPLRAYFRSHIHATLRLDMGLDDVAAEEYLATLATEFIRADASDLRLGDKCYDDLATLVFESDVLLNAQSFEQERQAHKHIGDYVMFWAGVFPETMRVVKIDSARRSVVDPITVGRNSYLVVSTFDHGRFAEEAPLFRRLGERFETYVLSLRSVRDAWFAGPGDWHTTYTT